MLLGSAKPSSAINVPARASGNRQGLDNLWISSLICFNSIGFFSIFWWTVNALEKGLTTSWLNLLKAYRLLIPEIGKKIQFVIVMPILDTDYFSLVFSDNFI